MHRANLSMALRSRRDSVWVIWPPLGSRCAQALWAAWYWELLTPNCSGSTLFNPLGNSLLLLASGNFGTPCERMQREWASAFWEFVDPPTLDEPPEPADEGLPPLHATASRAKTAVAMTAATVRAVGGHARCDWPMTRVLSFIMLSPSGLGRGCAWSPVRIGTRCFPLHGLLRPGWPAAPPRSSKQPMT